MASYALAMEHVSVECAGVTLSGRLRGTVPVNAELALIHASPPMESMWASYAQALETVSVESVVVERLRRDITVKDTVKNAPPVLANMMNSGTVFSALGMVPKNVVNVRHI